MRNLDRKCARMVADIGLDTAVFPHEERVGCGFWRLKLPVNQSLVDGPAASATIRKLCVQTLIDRAAYLASIKPPDALDTRVVAAITLPDLFDAQIIVFFSRDYYAAFFDRQSPDNHWQRFPAERSLAGTWALAIPDDFVEVGYDVTNRDGDVTYREEIWIIGELDDGNKA